MAKERSLSNLSHGLADALRSLSQSQKERDNSAVAESHCHEEVARVRHDLNLTLTSLLASRSNDTSILVELQRMRLELDRTRSGFVIANSKISTLRGQMRELAHRHNDAESTITKLKLTSERELGAAKSKLASAEAELLGTD